MVSSLVSYAGYNYGTLFDSGMIANIVETDSSEASSYLSTYSVVWATLMGVIPALIVFKVKLQPQRGQWLRFVLTKLVAMLASLAVIAVIAGLYYQDYASVGRNNSYLKNDHPNAICLQRDKLRKRKLLNYATAISWNRYWCTAIFDRFTASAGQTDVTRFVVGETARTQNYQLNGYERETNPYTSQLDVISFKDVASCGTATAVSVPCMFSQLTRNQFDRKQADNQDNALDIMQRAGIDLLWKENDGGDKEVAHKIKKSK